MLNILTNRSEQSVDPDLLEQFDQGLHCLQYCEYFRVVIQTR